MSAELEEGLDLKLDFLKVQKIAQGDAKVVPVVIQDADSLQVLILAYANQAALDQTIQNKVATLYSTSRQALWIKGATSGDYLDLVEVRVNCEQNSLLYLVRPRTQGACHTKNMQGETRKTCYYRRVRLDPPPDLERI